MSGGVPDEVFVRLIAAADEAAEQIRTCHERVACPKCGARIGEQCWRLHGGVRTLKHPHRERWTLVQPAR